MSSSIIFFSLSKSDSLDSAMDLPRLLFSSLFCRISTSVVRWALRMGEWGNEGKGRLQTHNVHDHKCVCVCVCVCTSLSRWLGLSLSAELPLPSDLAHS